MMVTIDSKEALLADRWTYTGHGMHGNRFLNCLYGDMHVNTYDDKNQHVAALGTFGWAFDGGVPKITYKEALQDARREFGSVAMKLWWQVGWLYLDTGF